MALSPKAQEEFHIRMSRQTQLVGQGIENASVLVVGAGGIGSNAVHILISMGIHDITVIDPDIVNEENIFPGWFHPTMLGINKAIAMQQQAYWYGVEITAFNMVIRDFQPENIYDVVIVGTDDIPSRKQSFLKLRDYTSWWIDGRMGGMGCEMYCIDTLDDDAMVTYARNELRPSESTLLCGEKSTAYNTKGALSMMLGWNLRDISMRKKPPYQYVVPSSGDTVMRIEQAPVPKTQ